MKKNILMVWMLCFMFVFLTGCIVTENDNVDENETETIEPESLVDQTQDIEGLLTENVEYIGQIDANSIEVKAMGVQPEEKAVKVYRFSQGIKKDFDKLKLQEGDHIILHYKKDENDSNIIYGLQK